MSDFRIVTIVLGQLFTNCYFIYYERLREAIIVDPADDASLIIEKCKKMKLTPTAVLLTHGHVDHIMAAVDLRDELKIPIYAGIAERELLSDAYLNCSIMFGDRIELEADKLICDKEKLNLAGILIEAIATPGHTKGSVCYYIKNENALISGDTLFKNSYGRTDLPTGSFMNIKQSIKNKLFTLDDNTTVYPGHGDITTIAHEKRAMF